MPWLPCLAKAWTNVRLWASLPNLLTEILPIYLKESSLVSGLRSQTSLNGRAGITQCFDDADGRFDVLALRRPHL